MINPRKIKNSKILFPVLFFIFNSLLLGLAPVGSSSEAREGQVVHVILSGGDWLFPLRNGISPSKPPLFHWIGAMLWPLTGFDQEFAIRIPSLIFAGVILYLVSLLTVTLSSAPEGSHNSAHLVVAGVLATTYGFLRMALDSRVDMVFTGLLVGGLYVVLSPAFLTCERGGRVSWLRKQIFALLIAASVLAKGPLGVVLAAVIIFAVHLWLYDLARAFKFCLSFVFTIPLLLLITLPYYYHAAQLGPDLVGESVVTRQIFLENIQFFDF